MGPLRCSGRRGVRPLVPSPPALGLSPEGSQIAAERQVSSRLAANGSEGSRLVTEFYPAPDLGGSHR
jgi:hypothetical protein